MRSSVSICLLLFNVGAISAPKYSYGVLEKLLVISSHHIISIIRPNLYIRHLNINYL